MLLNAGLDTGDMLLSHSLPLGPSTTAEQLYPQLSQIGARLLIDTLSGLENGTITPRPQNHSEATLAPILTREDGRLAPAERTAQQAYNRWRGFYPWPGCWAIFRGKRFLVNALHPVVDGPLIAPGRLEVSGEQLLLGAAGNTLLALDQVQLEGKPRMPGAQFARDFQVHSGERLD
jgi:methionyl-tRNA formyltransferase